MRRFTGRWPLRVELFTPLNYQLNEVRAFLEQLYLVESIPGFVDMDRREMVNGILEELPFGMPYLAKYEHDIVGMVIYFPAGRERDAACCKKYEVSRLGSFHIDPAYDFLRMSELSLERVIHYARYLNKRKMLTRVDGSDLKLLKHYQRLGFIRVKEIEDGFEDWFEKDLMVPKNISLKVGEILKEEELLG